MPTSLDIVNGALDILGQTPLASIENPTDKNGSICARWYDKCRRYLLAYHPWDFAESDYSCPRSGSPSDPGYTDMYRLPNDFIELISIQGEGASFVYSSEYGKVDWTRRGNNILINANGSPSINIVYTMDFNIVSQFSPKFIEALEEYLASKIALPITKDAKVAAAQKEIAEKVISEAMSVDGQGKRIRRIEYSKAIAARKYGLGSTSAYRR